MTKEEVYFKLQTIKRACELVANAYNHGIAFDWSALSDCKVLAFDFRVEEQLVKCVAEDYHLFCFNDGRLSLNPSDMPADAGEEDSEEDVEENGNDCTTASERPYTGTSAMISAQKKEKENLPLLDSNQRHCG